MLAPAPSSKKKFSSGIGTAPLLLVDAVTPPLRIANWDGVGLAAYASSGAIKHSTAAIEDDALVRAGVELDSPEVGALPPNAVVWPAEEATEPRNDAPKPPSKPATHRSEG